MSQNKNATKGENETKKNDELILSRNAAKIREISTKR